MTRDKMKIMPHRTSHWTRGRTTTFLNSCVVNSKLRVGSFARINSGVRSKQPRESQKAEWINVPMDSEREAEEPGYFGVKPNTHSTGAAPTGASIAPNSTGAA